MKLIKECDKVKLFVDIDLYVTKHKIQTASGVDWYERIHDTKEDALLFYNKMSESTIPTNGYELHTAADQH